METHRFDRQIILVVIFIIGICAQSILAQQNVAPKPEEKSTEQTDRESSPSLEETVDWLRLKLESNHPS
jgi:hypothetical protein